MPLTSRPLHIESEPVPKTLPETDNVSGNEASPDYNTLGLQVFLGQAIHFSVENALLGVSNEYMPYFLSYLASKVNITEFMQTLSNTFEKIALEIKSLAPEGYVYVDSLCEVPIKPSGEQIARIKTALRSQQIINNLRRAGKGNPQSVIKEAVINEPITNSGLSYEAMRFLQAISPYYYNNLEPLLHLADVQEIDPKYITSIFSASCKIDSLVFFAKNNRDDLVELIKDVKKAISGNYFGYCNLLDPTCLNSERTSVIYRLIEKIRSKEIAYSLVEIKTKTDIAEASDTNNEISDDHWNDVAHTNFTLHQFLAYLLANVNSDEYQFLKDSLGASDLSLAQRILFTHKHYGDWQKYIELLDAPSKSLLVRVFWPIYDSESQAMDIGNPITYKIDVLGSRKLRRKIHNQEIKIAKKISDRRKPRALPYL